jgi:hypothetical protein
MCFYTESRNTGFLKPGDRELYLMALPTLNSNYHFNYNINAPIIVIFAGY